MTNKFGVHALVWVGGWSEAEARKACESTAEAGYDLIELVAMHQEGFDTDLTAKLLQEHGLSAGASLGLEDHNDVSSDDPEIVARGRKQLNSSLEFVRDVGGTYLGGAIFSKLGRYTKPVTERGRANSIESIALLADRAKDMGITLGLEFCNRYETNVLNTTAHTLQFIEEVGRDNLVAHLDTYHMNIEEESFREPVLAAAQAGKLGYVHIGESHRGQLGTGNIPWAEFFDALKEAGYDGTMTFESFSSEVVHPTLSTNLAIWRNLWVDSMAMAKASRQFVRDNYESEQRESEQRESEQRDERRES